MEQNDILMIYGTNYKEMTKQLLTEAKLWERIPDKQSRIGIKPNLVSPTEASWGATTHPEVVEGIIEYLKENGFENLVMLEGSWVGTGRRKQCRYAVMTGFLKHTACRFWICRRIRPRFTTAPGWSCPSVTRQNSWIFSSMYR